MMRNILIIFLLVFFWSCTSCNSDNPKNDTDKLAENDTENDIDSIQPDIDPEDESIDADSAVDEETDESDDPDAALPDSDNSVPDTAVNDDEFIDDCDVKLIDAKFPYYDKDSNITFCRPGCDAPTEKDPQCMSNLWREQNHNLCHQYPEYDCCGYPCVLENLKPMTKEETDKELVFEGQILVPMHKCDLFLSVWNNDGTHGVVKSWNMSEGKVGFYLYTTKLTAQDWPVQSKHVTYDIATKKYNFIVPSRGQEQAYFKGNRVGLVSDKRNLDLNNSYIFLAYIKDDGFKTLAYKKKVHRIAYEPAMNDKWVFVNLQETATSPYKMMYAKVGDPSSGSTADSWKWTVLGEGTLRMSNLSGDRLALFTDDLVGYICDLDKSPKSLNDCYKVNQGEEGVRYLTLDKENSGRAVYSSTLGKIVLMEYKAGKWNYTDLITSYSDEVKDYAIGFIVNMVRGKTMLYEEAYQLSSSTGHYGDKLCYYNFNSQKKYCMKKMDKDEEYSGIPIYPYGDAEFEGKWLLYQKLNSTPLILRDMECYCKEEGVCPFEE